MKYWRARKGSLELIEYDIERETDSCIWINNRRVLKRSSFDNYFKTRLEALDFLLKYANSRLAITKSQLEAADTYRESVLKLY